MTETKEIYSGEGECCECEKRAYYKSGKLLYCGRHARTKGNCKELPKRDKDYRDHMLMIKLQDHSDSVEQCKKTDGTPGLVTLQRLLMMRNPQLSEGYVMIFPNNKHGKHRFAAFDCCELSPMRLGPVDHGQPGLPPAMNIENFHQGSKCFIEEMDVNTGEPTALFNENRISYYRDVEPHRHKYFGSNPKNRNIPKYFVWVTKDGKIHKLDYIESRQFYCNFYERLASRRPEYEKLRKMLTDGYSIQICGYDAHPFDPISEAEAAYVDDTKPFGHERVLAVMLSNPPERYPWHRHKTFDF